MRRWMACKALRCLLLQSRRSIRICGTNADDRNHKRAFSFPALFRIHEAYPRIYRQANRKLVTEKAWQISLHCKVDMRVSLTNISTKCQYLSCKIFPVKIFPLLSFWDRRINVISIFFVKMLEKWFQKSLILSFCFFVIFPFSAPSNHWCAKITDHSSELHIRCKSNSVSG